MLDKALVVHCAPTLAGLKTGSLFTALHRPEAPLAEQAAAWDRRLAGKGVRLAVLRRGRLRRTGCLWGGGAAAAAPGGRGVFPP